MNRLTIQLRRYSFLHSHFCRAMNNCKIIALVCSVAIMLTSCVSITPIQNNSVPISSNISSEAVSSETSSADTTSHDQKVEVSDSSFNILKLSKKLSVNDKPVSLPCTVLELGGNFEILEKHEKLNVKAMEPTTYVSKLVDNNTYSGEVSEIAAVFVSDVSKDDIDLSKKPITGISICGHNGEPTANSIETLKIDGIGVGSTREEVLAKFGMPKDPYHPLGMGDKEYAVMRYGDENGYMMLTIETHTRSDYLGKIVFVSFYLYDKSEQNDPALEGVMFTIYDVLNSTKVNGKEVGFPFSFEEIKKANLTEKFILEEYSLLPWEYDYYFGLGRVGVEYYPKFSQSKRYNHKEALCYYLLDIDNENAALSEDVESKYTDSQVVTFLITKENQLYNPLSVDGIKIGDTREQVEAKLGKQYYLMNDPFDENHLLKDTLYYSDGMVSIYLYFDDDNLVDGIDGLINIRRSK